MEEQNVIIEITDTEIRLVVGYVKENKPHLVYVIQKPIKGLISNGEIVDSTTLTQIIASLREVRDPNLKEKLTINEVTVILPAIGLNIFESKESTNVVSNDSVIAQIDIANVVSQVDKETPPANSEIIEIVPDTFELDDGTICTTPPIGLKSDHLVMCAKVHTLPSRIIAQYKKVIESAHLKVRRFCVNSYAICELEKTISDMPKDYILVDMGAEISEITLVGNYSPFGTMAFQGGGSYIVERLVSKYGITPEIALNLLTNYGYSERALTFKPAIAKTMINGEEQDITQEDLNEEIVNYFKESFFASFDTAFIALLSDYQDQVKKLPIVFTGGFSMMIGFEKLAKEKFASSNSMHFLSPNVIGARNAQYSASVGGILIACAKKGALSEQRQKSKGLSRSN